MSDFTPHEAPVREVQALPVMLSGKLVGREAALAQVYAQLKESNPVLVHGPAGSGKTALAATLAGAYAQQPGGVLWLNVDNPRLEELLVRVGRAYHIDDIINSENPLGMVGAVEITLRSNKPFIVLDGVIQPDVASRFISRCVPGLPLLITTEPKLDGTWAALELDKLDPDKAAALFKQEARLTTDEHDIDVHGLAKLVNHMPLGIVVAARAMLASKQTPGDFLKFMQPIAASAGGNSPIAALTASFRGLNGALQGLVLMMGATFKGRASAELLSMISNAPLESVQQAMNILAQLNLVERTQRYGAFYYRLHPIVHAFAQTWLRGSNRLDELQIKVRDAVLAYAKRYSADTQEAYNKLATEMENFLAAARWSADQGERTIAAELTMALSQAGNFVSERGYLYELLQLREMSKASASAFPAYGTEENIDSLLDAEELEEDEEFDDFDDEEIEFDEDEDFDEEDEDLELEDEAFLDTDFDEDEDDLERSFISNVLEDEMPVTQAAGQVAAPDDIGQLRSALAQVRQTGDKIRQIELLKAIGDLQVARGMENEAISSYSEVLTTYEALEEDAGILETLDMLSALMVKTENSQAAVMHATRGVKLADTLDDRETRMHLLTTLGDAHQQLGESENAVQDYLQALQIARNSDDTQNEGIILYKLGYAQLDNSDPDTATNTWEQALTLFKAQDNRRYEGRVLGGLGSAYGDLERWAEAVNFHTSALYIARETGDKEEEALQLSSLAYAATRANQPGEAVLRYRQALHLAYESQDLDNIVSNIVDLCRLLVESPRHISVAELLIDDALTLEPNDKDVLQLKESIDSARQIAAARNVQMIPINGTAQDYAENAYRLLEE